ncbi:MAG: hypothetical protein K0U72_01880 [Gammaproteobacteria bacterium]|nr:hypothetical protein [Gammaproteobacteria bacterium]
MINLKSLTATLIATLMVAACGSEQAQQVAEVEEVKLEKKAPEVSFKPSDEAVYEGTVAKPGAPYSISYRIVGTAVVGSPVTVDLKVQSTLGPVPLLLAYRINDASSMMLPESQPADVRMEAVANEDSFRQQVTVIPQREGRLYLNVSATFETADGTMSTVTAIPVQVGSGTRELQEHGELDVDENGETIRVLSPE